MMDHDSKELKPAGKTDDELDVFLSPTRVDGVDGQLAGLRTFCPRCQQFFDERRDRCPDDGHGLLRIDTTEGERIGEVIEGRLTLLGLVGSGGMGTVYRALQHSMEREVAVKLLHPSYSRDERQVARFLQEARSASRLAHPNIITLFDFGQSREGELYMVMELLRGRPLTHILRDEGALEPERALAIIYQVCDALHAAHQAEVIHRDIKPDNIFIVHGAGLLGEFVKVIDFGLAKIAPQGRDAKISQTGSVNGTPAYMSPEQILGQPVDARSDVYAVAVVLYEMLTGRPPFVTGQVAKMLISQVTEDPKPLSEVNPDPDRPAEIDEIVLRALSKNPDDRPVSTLALRRELQRARGRSSSLDDPPRLSQSPPAKVDGRVELPGEPSSFIGREKALDTLDALITAGKRLITVIGTGGMGKTRLVLRFATVHLNNSHGQGWRGIWFCDLSEARTRDDLCHAVAQALGIPLDEADEAEARQGEACPVVDRLGSAIAARGHVLLLLDNFEQVVDLAQETLGRWLEVAREACFIVTSRETLRLGQEAVFDLPPLSLPARGNGADVGSSEAVQLFVERAREARPTWSLAERDRDTVSEIVRRLDGVPLAIELAAARTSILSPAKILDRLGKQLDLLSPGGVETADPHATLRSTIEWSWSLLKPYERSTLAQLSTFSGGFSLDAAEAVVDLSPFEGDAPWVGDVLMSLRQKSLVVATEEAVDGELRFSLLECIRSFAAEKLDELDDVALCWRRHGEHFIGLFAGLDRRVDAGSARVLTSLARERENLLAISRRGLSSPAPTGDDARSALEAVLCLDPVLSTRGPFNTHLELLDRTIELAERVGGGHVSLGLLARAYHLRGEARRTRGRFAESTSDCQRALMLARSAGDRWVEGRVLWNLGAVADSEGRLDEAMDLLQRALVIQREVGDRIAEAKSTGLLGVITLWLARYDEARAHLEQAQLLLHEQGDIYEAVFLGALAALSQETGALNEARLQYQRAVATLREVGARRHEGMFLGYLGGLEWEQNRTNEARRRLGQALAIAREVGAKVYVALFLAMLAAIDADDERLTQAARGFEAAKAVLAEVGQGCDEPYRTAIQLHQGHLDLALSRRAELVGPGEEAAKQRAAVQRRLDVVSKAAPDGTWSPVQRSDDVRFAHRMLKSALEL